MLCLLCQYLGYKQLAGIVISVKILGLKFLQFIAVKATIARLLEALHIVGTSKTEKRGD
jgi:hypothetical protein